MLMDFLDTYARDYRPYKGGAWCYEDGCIYRGLELLHVETGEDRWAAHLLRLVDSQVGPDGSLIGYALSEYNIDNILPGGALLYLHRLTGEDRYRRAASTLARQLASHPRTASGVYWHKLRYPWQIWLDGLYMGQPFRIAEAMTRGDRSAVDDSISQIATALSVLVDPGTGLYKHAYDEVREQPWADPATGQSPAFWARAIGWLAMALVDVADLAGDRFSPLRTQTVSLLSRLTDLRQPDGLWLQVIDQPDLDGNYTEMSASAMFTYALLRGARLGLVQPLRATDAKGPGDLAETLFRRCLREKPSGGYEMIDICEVAGLGTFENHYRSGTEAYYLSERRVPDDAKGVGALMMAAALAHPSG
jgi:unsaturated rhamnogalacturonyl hydrolase